MVYIPDRARELNDHGTCIPAKMIIYSSYKVNESLTYTVLRNKK